MMRALDRFFFDPFPVAPLALCRIALGCALFALYASRALDYGPLLAPDGLSRFMGYDLLVVPPALTPLVLALTFVSSAAFALGLFTPIAGLLLVACHVSFNELVQLDWGFRNLIHALVLYVAVSGAGRAYALDSLLRTRREGTTPATHVPAWSARLLQFHITAIYISASYHRLNDPGWIQGEMVFEALTMSLWTRFPGMDFSGLSPWLEIGNYWSWAIELLAPIALWVTRFRVRELMVVNLVAMHALLWLSSQLGLWQPMMIAVLACFAPAGWSQRALDALTHLFGRMRAHAR